MLAEFKKVRQEGGATRRRWFQDEALGLIVWYGDGVVPTGFQFCYPGADPEGRALTWREDTGFSHARIDPGDDRPEKNMTPILLPDGAVPWARIEAEFVGNSAKLDPSLREFVMVRLERRGA